MVRRLRHSHPDAKIEFPVLSEIDIHRRQELLLLIPERGPIGDGPIRAVILQTERHLLGHVIAELHVGRKLESQALSRTVERAVQGGIERGVELADFLVHDGAQLQRPGVGRERRALITNLGGHAQSNGQFVTLRHRDPRADVRAHPLPTAIGLYAGELIEPRLEPLVPPMGDFQRLMEGVIGGQHAIHHTLRSAGREVTVQLHHGHTPGNQVRAIHLHFIVALAIRPRHPYQADHDGTKMSHYASLLPLPNCIPVQWDRPPGLFEWAFGPRNPMKNWRVVFRPCLSPVRWHWARENDGPASAPERAEEPGRSFAPYRGWQTPPACCPRLCAVGYYLSPSGLRHQTA